MENRKRIIELLTAVRYTTNDIEKVADEIFSLFNVSQQRELFIKFLEFGRDRHYTPLTQCSIIDMVEDFELNQ